jgi:phosphoribosyl 1,2-cyclic phosphodiesterase
VIRVRLWGTRGSLTAPGPQTLRYGGNTPCVQVVGFEGNEPGAAAGLDNPQIILDGGTGLVCLEKTLLSGPLGRGEGELHVLLSHFHWDHLIGIPFFTPIFVAGNRIVFYGGSTEDLHSSIERLFTSVYSPLKGVQNVAAHLEYRQVEPSGMEIAGFRVRTAENWHFGGCLSFRIDYGPNSLVYTTDHEAGDARVDARLVGLAQGTDLWILDAQYASAERWYREGWGHSSHLEVTRLALAARARKAILFHHSPDYDDDTLDRMAGEAQDLAEGSGTEVLMGRDGMVIELGT